MFPLVHAGSEIVIGPWSHSGFLDNRVGHVQSGKRSRFNHLTHAISFFDRCLGRQTDADTMDELAEADAADSAGGEPHPGIQLLQSLLLHAAGVRKQHL